jgi:hypothetical protein
MDIHIINLRPASITTVTVKIWTLPASVSPECLDFFFTITVTVISIKPWRICIRPDARWMYSLVSHKFCKAEKEDFGYRTDVSFELENSEHTSGIFLLFKKIASFFWLLHREQKKLMCPANNATCRPSKSAACIYRLSK